ncbi:MAG: cyclic nucleotide-binding protein [Burkholderiaceae bacterium]|jgi:CRP-like cAMP-binding protein|nr:MAG: cyclic nucleotide-binding protein [Burkholderiaceae bacterium]
MNQSAPASVKFNVQDLVRAVGMDSAYDTLNLTLTTAQWEILGSYLQPFALAQGQMLIEQGALDRTLYFIESGTLSVHYEDEDGRMSLALVGAGSVVGEGAFFSRLPRNASAVGAGPCKLWCLTPVRFAELANRQPNIALSVVMALGEVIGKRMSNKPRRIAVT